MDKVAVIGAGTMGAGIAQVAAAAGHEVYLYDAVAGAAASGVGKLKRGLSKLIERGKMTLEDREVLLGRIQVIDQIEQSADAALFIEAIIEDLEIKRGLFQTIESFASDSAILATNTSSISVTKIATAVSDPGRVVGMHFFNPAPVMKLVEVVRGQQTGEAVAKKVFEYAQGWGKTAVYTQSTPGFIVNRVARPYYGEALRLLEEGLAKVPMIDALMRDCGGFRMGPFQLMDLIGIDVNFSVSESVYRAMFDDPKFKPSLVQQEMVAAGQLGRKSGRGFYRYDEESENDTGGGLVLSPPPKKVTAHGDIARFRPLTEALPVSVELDKAADEIDYLDVDGVRIYPTDGTTATERAARTGHDDTVVFDLCLDYESASRMAIAVADQASSEAKTTAAGLFQAMGKSVYVVDDLPGLAVMRTVACLANEAADVVARGVATSAGVDQAMKLGVNYPRGPLEWAEAIGMQRVYTVMANLYSNYGEDRYRPSFGLRRQALTAKRK